MKTFLQFPFLFLSSFYAATTIIRNISDWQPFPCFPENSIAKRAIFRVKRAKRKNQSIKKNKTKNKNSARTKRAARVAEEFNITGRRVTLRMRIRGVCNDKQNAIRKENSPNRTVNKLKRKAELELCELMERTTLFDQRFKRAKPEKKHLPGISRRKGRGDAQMMNDMDIDCLSRRFKKIKI